MSRKLMRVTKLVRCATLAAGVVAAASCGDVIRSSRSPVMLAVNSLGGGTAGTAFVTSDVIRRVTSPAPCTAASPCFVVFNDPGTASLAAIMKDVTVAPTANNSITVTRYRVEFRRADGH